MKMSAPIRLLKTAFVIYYHQDFEKARTFLLDFGLEIAQEKPGEIFFKGYGVEPFVYIARQADSSSFGGAAYVIETRAEFDRARSISGASAVEKLDNFPGGGEMISLTDPAGHLVHLVYGQTEKQEQSLVGQRVITYGPINHEDEKPRLGKFQRFKPGPAPVYRWGHYGVTYPSGHYEKMLDFYTRVIGLAPSDFVHRDGKPITCFFHVDRGEGFSDHHCFFFKPIKQGQKPGVAHSAFEVHDFDIQQLGHNYLESKGYELCWGVGRHVLGSQVFDYWFDTSGFMVEHYADGDLVNKDTPIANVAAGPQALSVWGPPVPPVF